MSARDPLDEAYALGAAHERALARAPLERRARGAHFTPRALAERVVAHALVPLLADARGSELRVCDPACGAGALLLAALEALARAALTARTGASEASVDEVCAARRACLPALYGMDLDEGAVRAARAALALACGDPALAARAPLATQLVAGDALRRSVRYEAGARLASFSEVFSEVFSRAPSGFDAVVGNPPWVAYAGRAAQPLEAPVREEYARRFAAFAGYRTQHALFAERAAELLRPGGRFALVLPTSLADLAGYAPARAALARWALLDAPLDDLGDGRFAGVTQPCAVFSGARREAPEPLPAPGLDAPFALRRDDLSEPEAALLAALDARAKLAPELFRECGLQTEDYRRSLHYGASPKAPHSLGVYEGSDVRAFRRGAVRAWVDPALEPGCAGALRRCAEASVLVRQTARFPIAAAADGGCFRNSLLAGLARGPFSAGALCAWLNSAPVRWFHYARQRDARQGMPQVKVSHLRALPAPDVARSEFAALRALGDALTERNAGLDEAQRARLDALAGALLGLDEAQRGALERWRAQHARDVAPSPA